MKEYFTFDDVLIKPKYSDINSREEISLAQNFLGHDLEIPIISANMDYVTGWMMAREMYALGGLGILHRFYKGKKYEDFEILNQNQTPIVFSVGTRDISDSLHTVESVTQRFPYAAAVCVDIAHGHHKKVKELVKGIQSITKLPIVAGNIATAEGFIFLSDVGVSAAKVGIGPGSVCTTREVTGIGVPQLSAIIECMEVKEHFNLSPLIIADGGIKSSGDIVKALAAGADMVMLGSLLAGTYEAPGEARVAPDNSRWRPYRGQSIFGTNGKKYSPEGIEGWVKEKGPVADVIKQLVGGIKSGMSYTGARNLNELRAKAEFIKVSPGTSLESQTRVGGS